MPGRENLKGRATVAVALEVRIGLGGGKPVRIV